MTGHPHADLMAKAAEIAKTDQYWHRHFECKGSADIWLDMPENTGFCDWGEYRLKPRYINIGEYQVPEPVRELPDNDDLLWIADITQPTAAQLMWTGHPSDILMLDRGILHLTKEAAEAHIAALLSFTQIME